MTDASDPQIFSVSESAAGQRLDVFLADRLPQFSRSIVGKAIAAGGAHVDGQRAKASLKLKPHQSVAFQLPELPHEGPQGENIPLEILYEDDALVAVDKPPRMVVHPAKGHWSGTLASALAYHFQSLSTVGGATRPGIVHRLDRDTSGVILIAKNDEAHLKLAAQFEARTVQKEYIAFTRHSMDRDQDIINQPIGVHPYQREKMSIRAGHTTSREARTELQVLRRYRGFSKFLVRPKTGRTHQIRVHLAHVGCPVVSDRLYAGHSQLTAGDITGDRSNQAVVLDRQALHAAEIRFQHPLTGQPMRVMAPLPADLERLERLLVQHCSRS